MNDDAEMVAAKTALAGIIGQLPAEQRTAVPTNSQGEPQVQIVRALYRYEYPRPGEVTLIEVRELNAEEWGAAIGAHSEVYTFTRGFDSFLAFAWGELRNAQDEVLRQLREHTRAKEWMAQLIEYRILNYSTALKLYEANVTAQVNRIDDDELGKQVASAFSDVFDRSFAYRLIHSMRNAFQHGVRDLLSVKMTARLVDGSNTSRESEAHAYLKKDAFASSRAKASVRREVRNMEGDIDLFELGEEAFSEVQMLHTRLAPLLHPGAPAAARLINQYIEEAGGTRPHFHKYIRGLPTRGILGMTALDRGGFDYVARQGGKRPVYADGSPTDVFEVLPTYPSPGQHS